MQKTSGTGHESGGQYHLETDDDSVACISVEKNTL